MAKPELAAAVEAYNQIADEDLKIGPSKATNYRQLRPPDWPPQLQVHYELYRTTKHLGAELHIESDAAAPLATSLSPLAGASLGEGLEPLVWDSTWSGGRGRLTCRVPIDAAPTVAARAMVALIRRTRTMVGEQLKAMPGASPITDAGVSHSGQDD